MFAGVHVTHRQVNNVGENVSEQQINVELFNGSAVVQNWKT